RSVLRRLAARAPAWHSCVCVITGPAPPALSPLSLHDALPIYLVTPDLEFAQALQRDPRMGEVYRSYLSLWDSRIRSDLVLYASTDRKSTRLNSSHVKISYAVFCLKKKKRDAGLSGPRRAALRT